MPFSILIKAPLLAFGLFCGAAALAGEPPAGDLRNIQNLSGCFRVTYTFAEDGEHDAFAKGRPLGPITEWVGYEASGDGAVTLAHASFNRQGQVVPHWHEIWRYHMSSDTWTQEVRRGAPGEEEKELRYRCTAPWLMNRWQCHAGLTPRPFRDSGAPFGFDRSDYDRLERENILLVTPKGWVHNEHNRKMTESGAIAAYELGWIVYERIEDGECAAAADRFPRRTPQP
ncbi:MAG: DUF6607 family protein [Acetobacterales bacterium]